ncbi:SART-1 family protein DOT2 [Linum grandiflorum]
MPPRGRFPSCVASPSTVGDSPVEAVLVLAEIEKVLLLCDGSLLLVDSLLDQQLKKLGFAKGVSEIAKRIVSSESDCSDLRSIAASNSESSTANQRILQRLDSSNNVFAIVLGGKKIVLKELVFGSDSRPGKNEGVLSGVNGSLVVRSVSVGDSPVESVLVLPEIGKVLLLCDGCLLLVDSLLDQQLKKLGFAKGGDVQLPYMVQKELETLLDESGHLLALAFLYASKGMSSKALSIWRILARNYSSGLWQDPAADNDLQSSPVNMLSGREIAATEASKILEDLSDQDLVLQHLGWLLDMYLDPQNGKEPMFNAAVHLLHSHGESLDPLHVLEIVHNLSRAVYDLQDGRKGLVRCRSTMRHSVDLVMPTSGLSSLQCTRTTWSVTSLPSSDGENAASDRDQTADAALTGRKDASHRPSEDTVAAPTVDPSFRMDKKHYESRHDRCEELVDPDDSPRAVDEDTGLNGVDKSSKHDGRDKDRKRSSRAEDKDRDKDHRYKDRERSKKTSDDVSTDLDKEHLKYNERGLEKRNEKEIKRRTEKIERRIRSAIGGEILIKKEARENRDRERERPKDKEREKENEKLKDREKLRENDKDIDKKKGRDNAKEREAGQGKERSRERDGASKEDMQDDPGWSKDDKMLMSREYDGHNNVLASSFDGDQKNAERSSTGGHTSTSELRERIMKMKEGRTSKSEAGSEILSWVNKTHDLAGVKVLDGLDKVMEGGAVVLTLKHQSILAYGDINNEVDMLENVEIGEQKRRDDAYKAAKKPAGIYSDKFNDDPMVEKKMLPQYDEPMDEGVTLDNRGHFSGEAEKKLEEDKLDIKALEEEAIAEGLGVGDLGSRNDSRRKAREEQERHEAEMRSAAYQLAYAKADEASKALQLGQSNPASNEDVDDVMVDEEDDLHKSIDRARKLALKKQKNAVVGPEAIARLATTLKSNQMTDDQNAATEEGQEGKVVFTEIEEFVWGLQFDEDANKADTEDVFKDEDDAIAATLEERGDTDAGLTEANETVKDEDTSMEDAKEVTPDEIIHEAPVGKGLSGDGKKKEKNKDKDMDRFKDIRIERTDEFGRIMTPKEAFRVISHRFHGKGPGKMKQEKRMKQYQEELKLKQNEEFRYTFIIRREDEGNSGSAQVAIPRS